MFQNEKATFPAPMASTDDTKLVLRSRRDEVLTRMFALLLTLLSGQGAFATGTQPNPSPATQCANGDLGTPVVHSAGATPLIDAIANGDEAKALDMIAKGADPNDPGSSGCPPVYLACGGHNMLDVVRALIGRGAKLEARGKLGTPLQVACYCGSAEVVDYLISKGADLSARCGRDDYTPLHVAALASGRMPAEKTGGILGEPMERHPGRAAVVELLVLHGADVNATSLGGKTPLDLALEADRGDIAMILSKHGGRTGKALAATRPATEP